MTRGTQQQQQQQQASLMDFNGVNRLQKKEAIDDDLRLSTATLHSSVNAFFQLVACRVCFRRVPPIDEKTD